MTESTFVPSETPDGYDFRGNKTENFVAEGTVVPTAVSPSEAAEAAPVQVHPVASESAGYKAPGGLTRDEIRARMNRVRPYSAVTVDIPEWDISVEVRSMSLGARNQMAVDTAGENGEADMTRFIPAVMIASTFDAVGDPVFSTEDIPWLNSLDAHVLDKIAEPALELNGIKGAAKKVEEAAGKFEKTETSESSSS